MLHNARLNGKTFKMEKPRLLIFDFDGTALGGHLPYAQFPPEFVEFLDGLGPRGIHWATNTTWGPEGQFEVLQRSGLKSTPAFLTGGTGRLIARVENGVLVPDKEHEQFILEQDLTFRKRVWPRVRPIFMALLEKDLLARFSFDFFTPQSAIDFTAAPGCENAVWELIQPLIDSEDYYSFGPSRSAAGTLLPAHMNKGEPVKIVQERLGISPEETIAAGDGFNDLHMFDPALAGWMVCPANADPLVKEHIRRCGGIVAAREFSWGVIEGVEKILSRFDQP